MAGATLFQLPEALRRPSRSGAAKAGAPSKEVTFKVPPQLPQRPPAKIKTKTTNDNIGEAAQQRPVQHSKSIVETFSFIYGGSKKESGADSIKAANVPKLAKPSNSRPSSLTKEDNPQSTTPSKPQMEAKSKSSLFSQLSFGTLHRRASSISQEVTRRTSAITVQRKKTGLLEDEKRTSAKGINLLTGQNNSSRQLSSRLSYARSTSDRGLANPRKRSENIFTKEEQRSIRLAATQAKNWWDDNESRTSDDTSVGSGPEDELKKRPTLVLSMQNIYKEDNSKSRQESFEMVNPQHHDHHFGMIIFSGGGGSMVLEEDEC